MSITVFKDKEPLVYDGKGKLLSRGCPVQYGSKGRDKRGNVVTFGYTFCRIRDSATGRVETRKPTRVQVAA